MKNIIFIVNGYPRAGKDTFVEMAAKIIASKGYAACALSSIDPIKEITDGLGIPREPKTPEKRALWAGLKDSLEKYDHHVSRLVMGIALNLVTTCEKEFCVGFIHAREPDSIEFMKTISGDIKVMTIFVDRPDADRVTSNAADIGVENYDYDIIVKNDSTLEHLEELAESFVMNALLLRLHKRNR